MKVFVTGAGGYIGGTVAAHLAASGYQVSGLIRRPEQSAALTALGIKPILGSLDDHALLIKQAQAADAVINAASSDDREAVEALIAGLAGSNKPFLHTSGSSIVGDASGGEASDKIYDEDGLPTPTPDKAARVAIDTLVRDASKEGVRSAVLCNTLIYGHGKVPGSYSVQLPRLIAQARKSGIVRHVGPGRNIWSNVHVDDVAALYRLVLDRLAGGTALEGVVGGFFFVESGEAAFHDMAVALADVLKLKGPEDWPLEEAKKEWGYEMASYGLGSNSRVRSRYTRPLLGWRPQRTSVTDWIRQALLQSDVTA